MVSWNQTLGIVIIFQEELAEPTLRFAPYPFKGTIPPRAA